MVPTRLWSYLYVCGPQLWDLRDGLRGHAGGMVAYCLSPALASRLIEFADQEVLSRDPRRYTGWDSALGYWLNARGLETYLPYRNYGEHGGLPNPEHRRAGLRPHHRADVLAAPLAFLPAYARGSRALLLWRRCCARAWGVVLLLSGRYLSRRDLSRSAEKARLLRVALGRQLLRRPPGGGGPPE